MTKYDYAFTTSAGIPMGVRIVRSGDAYGLDNCLMNTNRQPLVEFFDLRHAQFITRYGVRTLLGTDDYGSRIGSSAGLCLQGDVPAWNIDRANAARVADFLEGVSA